MSKYYENDSAGNKIGRESEGFLAVGTVVTDDTTLVVADSGKVYLMATDAKTFTLPATVKDLRYTFINTGADGAVGITISPNASDKIMGSLSNGGQKIIMSGTDDKDIVNTKATALKGDYLTLVGDGADGWYIERGNGVWTEESQAVAYTPIETLTDDYTVVAADHGKTFFIATDAKVITLPATIAGMKFRVVNSGADGNNIVTISPNSSDAIFGNLASSAGANADATTANGLVAQASGTDDKDWINTKATANKGDWVELTGDGDTGWFITGGVGVWASE